MSDRTVCQSTPDAVLFDRSGVEYHENMAREARFAKKVNLPDGRVGILVNGQAIAVEPQSAVSWIVSALRNPRDLSFGMTLGGSGDRIAGGATLGGKIAATSTSSAVTGVSNIE